MSISAVRLWAGLAAVVGLAALAGAQSSAPANTPATTKAAPKAPRKALLVGNRDYRPLPPVRSAIVDVNELATALRAVGFETKVETNLRSDQLSAKLLSWIASINEGDVALVYFTGYAAQSEGNRLLPVDFKIPEQGELSSEFSVAGMQGRLSRRTKGIKIIVLDAARENADLTNRFGEGLASESAMDNTLITLSTAPGRATALPAAEKVSPFAKSLIDTIKTPGLGLVTLFGGALTRATSEASGGKQRPSTTSNIVEEFYLVDPLPEKKPEKEIIYIPTKTEQPLEPGDIKNLTAGALQLPFAYIPDGAFEMGCVESDHDCLADEKPRHKVSITKPFWMATTETTVGAYREFANAKRGGQMPSTTLHNKGWRNPTDPITNVTWEDASEYCSWLKGRLPSEAEWEYAARGGKASQVYPWDGTLTHDMANFDDKKNGTRDQYLESAPAGTFPPNKWNLREMNGNAWEWVADWFSQTAYAEAGQAEKDPRGPDGGKERVVRGGSFMGKAKDLRTSVRGHFVPNKSQNVVGFRCIVEKMP